MVDRQAFLGIDLDRLDTKAAVEAIATRARRLEPFSYVVTPNVDHFVRLDRMPELRPLYRNAWLTLCDSRILELIAKASGLNLPAAPGADIVEILFNNHMEPGQTLTIVGGDAGMIRAIRNRHPHAGVRWFDAPHDLRSNPASRQACADFIVDNPTAFVFLAVGSPQQEMIACETLARGGAVGVALCCGASLDFLSGKTARAPAWMRASRLEWLHRLGSEPGRLWRRYLMDGPNIIRLWLEWRKLAT